MSGERFQMQRADGIVDWAERDEVIAALGIQGGGADPLQIAEIVAAYLQAPPPAGGASPGRLIDFGGAIEMYQSGSLPGGVRARIDYKDAKVVCQGFYTPKGLSWVEYLLAFTDNFIDNVPDIDVAVGGEWEWKLPWGHIAGLRGYFTFPVGIYYADHPRTMGGVGMIRTEGVNTCYAAIRVDMVTQMMMDPDHFGEEKGVLNRRRPWGKWTPGSWLKFTAAYPTE